MTADDGPLYPVVAGVIRQDSRFLLARRAAHKSDAGYWEFPGGQVEPGEAPQEALVRELREELLIETRVGPLIFQTFERGRTFFAFEVDIVDGTLRLVDHDAMRWVQSSDCAELALHPFDRHVAAHLG